MIDVTACIVTRGNVPLDAIEKSLPERWGLYVWDNSEGADLAVLGRYAAMRCADTDAIYVQDDDCVLPRESLLQLELAYEPGVLTTNMPAPFREHYSDSCLIGFGAIFDRTLPDEAFKRMHFTPPGFDRTCDVFFTALTPDQQWLDLPYKDQPYATGPDRMYRQPQHIPERAAALELARLWR